MRPLGRARLHRRRGFPLRCPRFPPYRDAPHRASITSKGTGSAGPLRPCGAELQRRRFLYSLRPEQIGWISLAEAQHRQETSQQGGPEGEC
jgi:hypothetical protein